MAVRKALTTKTKAKATSKAAIKTPVVAKKAPVAAKKKALVVTTAFTKAQCVQHLSDESQLKKSEVTMLFDAFNELIHAHLKPKGPGYFTWPGLLKIVVSDKPATPARWAKNPFTGEEMKFKAKPKSRRVKIRALKGLKTMV